MSLRKSKSISGIDEFLENNKEFWQHLQTFCVAECCGIDAFDFSKENIERIIRQYNYQNILNDINESIEFINKSSSKLISSSILNHCVLKNKFIELLEDIKRVLLSVSV
ncbi:DUF6331 family protein [Aquimarina algiphila]|uniref:Uncharacterized protein n=1 Tax=Aquimarina algiphila TaxID=2047982 RepID=A0A554VI58_9FLAO|nr:DUF6331 family protein [Aquimarina algiphila]TSE07289.1 hypothetical protein FOF46_16595 [Aquimarina algiphila]